MQISIRYPLLPKSRSFGASLVMDAFGVQFDQKDHIVCERLELNVKQGQIVFFTGPSGSGKSSLLRALCDQLLTQQQQHIIDIASLDWPDRPLVDALPLDVKDSLDLLSACGLGEAQLLLRTPSELSEGQRYRFRLALGLAQLRHRPAGSDGWLIADEFTATLDRTLARVLAYNLRKLARRAGIGCLLATTHEDVITDLSPDLLVRPDLDGNIVVEELSSSTTSPPTHLPECRARGGTKRISFFRSVGTGRAPVLTGPTLPVGIIEATPSASSSGSRSCGMANGPLASASSAHRPAACSSATGTSASAGRAMHYR